LSDHRGWRGKEYDREWKAHEGWLEGQGYGQTPLVRQELARVCYRRVRWCQAVRQLEQAERERDEGKGRRPSAMEIERWKRREGREDKSYHAAVEAFRVLARGEARERLGPTSGVEIVRARGGSRARRADNGAE
jgi:hypothetical protein